ncbi:MULTISPECIES: hypothetical protein [unclassified Methanoregula]|uniref:hypothetical protein n=1 Tax=unclassified Methanoregula TaxID=2649730 RepID=UPI0025D4BFC8|nr:MULTISPECIES: hypothetical protein [unclassified Methanoregula]
MKNPEPCGDAAGYGIMRDHPGPEPHLQRHKAPREDTARLAEPGLGGEPCPETQHHQNDRENEKTESSGTDPKPAGFMNRPDPGEIPRARIIDIMAARQPVQPGYHVEQLQVRLGSGTEILPGRIPAGQRGSP